MKHKQVNIAQLRSGSRGSGVNTKVTFGIKGPHFKCLQHSDDPRQQLD